MSYSAPFPGREWTRAVELIGSEAVDTDALISNVYPLGDAARPFTDVRESGGRLLKVLYRIGDDTEEPR
jgi:L-iditol 2-dehydrogenase/galactitol-1-phosphate 5-dehydrogenase